MAHVYRHSRGAGRTPVFAIGKLKDGEKAAVEALREGPLVLNVMAGHWEPAGAGTTTHAGVPVRELVRVRIARFDATFARKIGIPKEEAVSLNLSMRRSIWEYMQWD